MVIDTIQDDGGMQLLFIVDCGFLLITVSLVFIEFVNTSRNSRIEEPSLFFPGEFNRFQLSPIKENIPQRC